jgi:hypothetical protein
MPSAKGRRPPAIDPHARRRQIEPDQVGGLRGDAGQRLRDRRHHAIGELHEGRAFRGQRHHVGDQPQPRAQRLGEQRQTGNHSGGRLAHISLQQPAQPIGIPLHHGRGRIARAQQAAEILVELDQHQPRWVDAVLHQRFGDRPGAGTKLDDRTARRRIDIARHGARQRLARRHHRAHRQRLLDQRTDELHLVVETQRFFGGGVYWHRSGSRGRAGPGPLAFTGTDRRTKGQATSRNGCRPDSPNHRETP